MAFKEMKIKVMTPEESERVQHILFGLGCKWNGDSHGYVQLTTKQALFVDENGRITNMTKVDKYFDEHRYPEYVEMHGQLVRANESLHAAAIEPLKIVPRPKADVDALHKAIDLQRLKELNAYLMQAIDNGTKVTNAEHMEYNSLLTSLLSYH